MRAVETGDSDQESNTGSGEKFVIEIYEDEKAGDRKPPLDDNMTIEKV